MNTETVKYNNIQLTEWAWPLVLSEDCQKKLTREDWNTVEWQVQNKDLQTYISTASQEMGDRCVVDLFSEYFFLVPQNV